VLPLISPGSGCSDREHCRCTSKQDSSFHFGFPRTRMTLPYPAKTIPIKRTYRSNNFEWSAMVA
jgi:hypothetical protein